MYEPVSLAKLHHLPAGSRILTVGEWGEGPSQGRVTLRSVTGWLPLALGDHSLPAAQGRGEFCGVLRTGPVGHWLEVESFKVLGLPPERVPTPAEGAFSGMLRVFRYGQTLWGQCSAQHIYLLQWPSGHRGLYRVQGLVRAGSPLQLQVTQAEPLSS